MASTGGKALRKLAEISRASRERDIWGKTEVRNAGIAFGVVDVLRSKWVVPV